MIRRVVILVAALLACSAAPAHADELPAAAPIEAAAPAVPSGVDVADYGRAFAYWGVDGLDVKTCPQGPIAVYDEARVQSIVVPVTASTGEVQQVHPIAFVYGGLGSCKWYFGDVYRAMDAVHRCHVVTHELGHLVGKPDGLGVEGDPLGVMGQFAITPQCAEVQPAEVRAEVAVAVASSAQPDPMAESLVVARAAEVAGLVAAEARWARYDREQLRRDDVRERRDRCVNRASSLKRPAKRRAARASCRARFVLPRAVRPSGTRP